MAGLLLADQVARPALVEVARDEGFDVEIRDEPPAATAHALVAAGFRRFSTYRAATAAGALTNSVFGAIKAAVLVGTVSGAGSAVAGYDVEQAATFAWVTQALLAPVNVFAGDEVAQRVRTGDIAVDLARPIDPQLAAWATDLGRAAFMFLPRGVPPLVLGILLGERENVADYLADVGLVAAVFCAASLVTGYVVPRAAGVRDDQAVASSMEIGVHNGTLAIYVAVEVLASTEMSVPAAVYSVFMFVFAALWGVLITRGRQRPVAPAL